MKFKGILLCTDLDETLLRDDKSISKENIDAIEYFKSQGGKFTFITGRVHKSTKAVIQMVAPNAPIGCLNGGSIYDWENDKNLFEMEIDRSVSEILKDVEKKFTSVGIEVITHEHIYYCKKNYRTEEHRIIEAIPDKSGTYDTICGKWAKAMFMDEKAVIDQIIPYVAALEKAKDFDLVRSTDYYYEILPKNASKGNLLIKLADILHIDRSKTIAVGDNENDISMIKAAQVGYAVSNAVAQAKEAADIVTVSNMEHAIAKIIEDLDKGIILN